ncbi:uracil-DNA glycosylase [Alkaliphilus metalliredigens QYMF]|uniref:Uracil-DNA glycosylase n=1 Tax=Alkaliphilus metalliredigens (strain QYMF) TaxID=293826 RepID=UNG_ALKMQ|nr:uracil-DNA glycosylase [Alkaliphilus metalliredigens]A6TVW5.1 RecName: Full=Uracil-DNA glycosylase; Short=UDG [Alkaliphilus metalliredigens QYMF]ABR50333.1 uracil-DNA glycosylase [Alkaliphilus metalliredigens QYMF]
MSVLHNDWAPIVEEEYEKTYYLKLKQFLMEEYRTKTVYPDEGDIFNALQLTPFGKVKAVILGQDPYHGPGQAHGLSFSVKPGVKTPPSLKNIFKELNGDLGYDIPEHGYLNQWAQEGVLMLNTVLTVRRGEPNSHKGAGWEQFTDQIIKRLNERETAMVFILWGKNAQEKEALITNPQHHIIKSPHPSPFSAHRGFFGSHPFSKTNDFLRGVGIEEINWNIEKSSDL